MNRFVRDNLINLGLMCAAAVLFALSFPNLLVENGLPLLAWVAYAPVFAIVCRTGLGASVFWGALYGYAAYSLFNYWLSVFHPLAGLIVNLIYLVYLAVLFFCLKLADIFFPKRGWLAWFCVFMAYEYLRTKGFLGYSYGITGYSQWKMIPLIQIASIFGVWGVSALVIYPSAWLGGAVKAVFVKSREWGAGSGEGEAGSGKPSPCFLRFVAYVRRDGWLLLPWAAALCAALVYGASVPGDFSQRPSVRLALIQHNSDPWRGGLAEYRNNFRVLSRLSDEALAASPKPDLVVWSETAFVPRIYWHSTYRDDEGSWLLVKDLLDYLAARDTPFLIGNDDAVKDPALNPNAAEGYQIDYNAVMLFKGGKMTGRYRKLHLVPFTEHFPYQKQLPWVYDALIHADTHFWEKGKEATVFSIPAKNGRPAFKFSSPICFEDTFGYLSRDFVRAGVEVIINLSNDAWSASLPAQNQHLSMAVFRAVENRRAMARSTASGQTCGVDPKGRVTAMAAPFTEAWLTVELPLMEGVTFYTKYGDWTGTAFTAAAIILLTAGLAARILRKRRNASREE